jgi:hypothetical protein
MERYRFQRLSLVIIFLLGALLVGAPGAAAQTESGKVVGRVVDDQGGVLPGVTVTLTNIGTKIVRTTVTDDGGQYVFAALPPGDYEMAFELSTFAPKKIATQVPVGSTVDVNATLAVGGLTEQVQVTAAPEIPTINTTTQDIAVNITEKQLRELPTITRNPYDLVAISGNISKDDAPGVTDRGAMGFNMNGLRSASTNVLLDGSSNNDEFTGAVGQAVSLDAVQELSIITSNFSAQFGRASAGIVNVVTKSGSNDFRGSAFEFYRDESLATNTFDNKARDIEKDQFDRNQYGGSIGGPIVRNKAFFFGSGEFIRVRSSATDVSLVPTTEFLSRTAANTQAFFSPHSLAASPSGRFIRAGELTGVIAGGPFSQLPASLPVFQEVERSLPIDAGGGDPVDEYQITGRADWALNDSSNLYVRYALQDRKFFEGANANSPYVGFNTTTLDNNHNILGSYSRVWSPRLTTQTKFVFNRLKNDQPLGEQPPSPTLYMRSTQTTVQGVRIALPGYLPFNPGTAIPFGGPQNFLQFYEDATWLVGSHDLRFGGSYVYFRDDRTFGAFLNSVETLGGSLGQALDNLMLGQIIRFESAIDPQGRFPGETITLPVTKPSFTRNNRYHEYALYFNDSWALGNVRLNLGLRYEYYGPQRNKDPELDSNFYLGSGSSIFEQIRNGRVLIAPDSPVGDLWAADRNNFAPRVGFAWDVTGDGKTSLRAGYGIGYERNFGNVTFNVIQNPPNYAVLGINAPQDVPVLPITTDNVGPLSGTGTAVLPIVQLRAVKEDIVNAYAHFWSVAFQREILPRTVASVEYTGSNGVNLYSIENPNRSGTGAVYLGSASPTTRLNTQYSNINMRGNNGKSRYHGVTFNVENRGLADLGLQFTARYTLGRTRDNLSTTFSESANNFNLGLLDPYDPDLDWGYADFDVRHRLGASVLYETPFGGSDSALVRNLLGGWQINAIVNAQSGMPFTIFDCTNAVTVCARINEVAPFADYENTPTGDPNSFTYLDLTNQAGGVGSISNEITGTNEVPPAGGYPASMTERNAFRRPGRWNVDAVFAKRVRFGRVGVQGRIEMYNVFNHANLYVDTGSADISSSEQIFAFRGETSTGGLVGDGQRRIQLGVRFEF